MSISVMKKRDGTIVPFDIQKIINAIKKAFIASEENKDVDRLSTDLALEVYTLLDLEGNPAPTLEHVQDIVEQVLMTSGHVKTAKNYILYRQEHTRLRQEAEEVENRFGGAPVALRSALAGCSRIDDAVFCSFTVLYARRNQAVTDFAEAMAPGVAGSFRRIRSLALRLTLELLANVKVNEKTSDAWEAGLSRNGLTVALDTDPAALSREADLICGTLGCDRDTVTKAQEFAVRTAVQETRNILADSLRGLLQTTGLTPDALQGEAETPEGRLVSEVLQELKEKEIR